MPKLAAGGKYVYGWSVVSSSGEVTVPPEALGEYGIEGEQDLILIQGSEISGGFGVSRRKTLKESAMGVILERYSELESSPAGEPMVVEGRSKIYARAHLNPENRLQLTEEMRKAFGIKAGDRLLAIRGSDIAIAFAATGPILEEAGKHGDLPVWE